MKNLILLIAVVILFSACGTTSSSQLYYREASYENPDGKDLVMVFDEVERNARTSSIRVTFESGSSVASSMFIMRGMYDISNERRARYFAKLMEWEDDQGRWNYLVGFSNRIESNPAEYFEVDIDPIDVEFTDTRDLDIIFRDSLGQQGSG